MTRSPLDVVEGFYTGHAVWTLHKTGALENLRSGCGTADLARELGYDERLLAAVLEYVFHTTDLLVRVDGRYEVSAAYRDGRSLGFQLDKFLGSYGACIDRMADVLCDPALGSTRRDDDALAKAFQQLEPHRPSLTRHVLETWGVRSCLDLGCGTGSLLIELAEADPLFRGWGVDASPSMIAAATRSIRDAGLEAQLCVARGDITTVGQGSPPDPDEVQALYGRSIMNEFFADDGRAASEVLRVLSKRFPSKLFFVEDYYGCLTRDVPSVDDRLHTLLQDLAQAFSGQGVPPSSLEGWTSVYCEGGCSLVHAYEGTNDGISWFIHVIQL